METADSLASVQAAVPRPPRSLVPRARLERVASLARALPAALTDHYGFECRLGGADGAVDLQLHCAAGTEGQRLLAGCDPAGRVPAALTGHPEWARLQRFCQVWSEPTSALGLASRYIWLEFDLPSPDGGGEDVQRGWHVPGVFWAPTPLTPLDTELWPGVRTNDDPGLLRAGALAAVRQGMALLRGEPPSASLDESVVACFEHAGDGEGIHVYQAGLLLSRASDTVRFCVGVPSAEVAVGYLRSAGWRGGASEQVALAALVGRAFGLVDEVYLDVDVQRGIGPRLGIECAFAQRRQPGQEPRWAALLGELVENGWCTPEKRDGLMEFPGESMLPDGRGAVRYINHVKLVYERGGVLEAKAYCAYRLVPRAAARGA